MEQLSLRTAAKMVSKLRIKEGDVLLIKHGTSLANEENIKKVSNALMLGGHRRTLVIVADGQDLSVLDEKEMNKNGWFRIEALRGKILKRLAEKIEDENESPGTDL